MRRIAAIAAAASSPRSATPAGRASRSRSPAGPARLNVAAGGAYLAVAPAGECSLVMLVADDELALRKAASAMGPGR